MTQYVFNVGSTLNVTAIPEFANLNTQQLPMEEIRILVDTSIPRTVVLPYSLLFPVRNIKVTVVDITGNAVSSNITVQASSGSPTDVISGASSFVINAAYQAVRFEILNTNQWDVINAGIGGGVGSNPVIILGDAAGSSVRCGQCNVTSGCFSTVSGGYFNTASNIASTIGGGVGNLAQGTFSTVGGGISNCANTHSSTIGGGCCNSASGYIPTIGGGFGNIAIGDYSTIGGGYCNAASCLAATISGGYCNAASAAGSMVGGGTQNIASCFNATVAGGDMNTASGNHATIGGGCANTASALYSTVSGGYCNTASACYASILGGRVNIASCISSHIVGECITTNRACATFMNKLSVMQLDSGCAGLPSGSLFYDPATQIVCYIP